MSVTTSETSTFPQQSLSELNAAYDAINRRYHAALDEADEAALTIVALGVRTAYPEATFAVLADDPALPGTLEVIEVLDKNRTVIAEKADGFDLGASLDARLQDAISYARDLDDSSAMISRYAVQGKGDRTDGWYLHIDAVLTGIPVADFDTLPWL